MNATEKMVEKITPRLTKVRNEKLDFIWNDFLESVEKVVNKLSDEELAATAYITIYYQTYYDNEGIYRAEVAYVDCLDGELVYEEKPVRLGNKKMLERAFKDVREKAKQDSYCGADHFDIEELFEMSTGELIELDFNISRIAIEFNKTSEYKIVSTN